MQLTLDKGFNPKNLELLRTALQSALDEAGFEGLEFDTGRIKYENAECTVPLKVKIKGMKSRDDEMLEMMAQMKGLTLESRNGRRLVEFNSRNRKYPFIYLDEADGKRYKCDERSAQFHFAAK